MAKSSHIALLLKALEFTLEDGSIETWVKKYPDHKNYKISVDIKTETIDYGQKIHVKDKTTSNFKAGENFVVLECVNRLLEKGYKPESIILEEKWSMGKKEKGKLDILVKDNKKKAYLMIECKTWGDEYLKEKSKMQRDGGQLFSYFQQDKAAHYLCLYTSRLEKNEIQFTNDIVVVEEYWKQLNTVKETVEHWNKNYKDNGIFDTWANPYDVEIKALTRGRLKALTQSDSGRIFNQFAEILRHNVVSDKPNAFNKILNLFICKIIDENKNEHEELKFQWKEDDTHQALQSRLNDLYKEGMHQFLDITVTDYSEDEFNKKISNIDDEHIQSTLKRMFNELRLQKNPEFAFKEVYDQKSFNDNAQVVKEVVELLQPYQFRYGHKQQFLGDFFELLLNTSIKQESGQFFTPIPIAKFIVSSLPIKKIIDGKIEKKNADFLPYVIDYAAGSGHFLTEWMDAVQDIIENIDESKIAPREKDQIESWHSKKFAWAKEYVYGIEADYRLVKTTKISSFLNGDGEANIIRADGLDSFKHSTDFKGILKEYDKDYPKDNGQFDVLIANPPYSVSAFKNSLKYGEESFDLYSSLSDQSSEIECLFIERAKQLLKEGGLAGIILPSSILSNKGIYTKAREIIFKYFDIVGITELGSHTFMATGTNTVILFLRRRDNYIYDSILNSVKKAFNQRQDVVINGVKAPLQKYIHHVWDSLNLDDYWTLLARAPNEAVQNHEIFKDYKSKIKAKDEDALFTDILDREIEKVSYFISAYRRQVVVVKSGEKEEEKEFLGYGFSDRRGHEGIHPIQRNKTIDECTKLYDLESSDNPKKASTYLYQAFTSNFETEIDDSLKNNISHHNLIDMMTFDRESFDKTISLILKKKVKIDSKWPMVKLGEIMDYRQGLTYKKYDESPSKTQRAILTASNIKLGSGRLDFSSLRYLTDEKKVDDVYQIKKDDILICTSSGSKSHLGKNAQSDKDYSNYYFGGFCAVLRKNGKLVPSICSIFLNTLEYRNYIQGGIGSNINNIQKDYLLNYKIPLPSMNIQQKIVAEIANIEKEEQSLLDSLSLLKTQCDNILKNDPAQTKEIRFSKVAQLEYGKALPKSKRVHGPYPVMGSNGPDGCHNEYLIEGPNIIVGRKGSAGKLNYVEGHCFPIDTTFYVNYNKNDVDIKYLYYLMKNLQLEELAKGKGIGVPGLNRNLVHNLKIRIHTTAKQKILVDEIEKLEAAITDSQKRLEGIPVAKYTILKKYL